MNTDALIKFLQAGEPKWVIPGIKTFSDKELLQELKRRGYKIKQSVATGKPRE